jgi:hypothetical protein
MSRRWVVRLEKSEVDSVKKLRLAEGAEVCEREHDIWVQGTKLDESLARQLRRHPHARRHWVLDDGQLISPEKRVPNGYLPEGPWVPLRDWMTVCLPPALFAAQQESRLPVSLVRSSDAQEPAVLMTNITHWHQYGSQAPKVRLDRWLFAAAADGRVLVRGIPLPPLPGERFVVEGDIAVPVGWSWSPPVQAENLRELLGIQQHDLAILHADGSWEHVLGGQFVRATRSAIRATAREFCDG